MSMTNATVQMWKNRLAGKFNFNLSQNKPHYWRRTFLGMAVVAACVWPFVKDSPTVVLALASTSSVATAAQISAIADRHASPVCIRENVASSVKNNKDQAFTVGDLKGVIDKCNAGGEAALRNNASILESLK